MKRTTKKLLTVAATAALFTPMAAMATNGYFGHGIGMKSMGMGGAGIALAQDSMASATNPAAAADVGNRIDFGLNLFRPDRKAALQGTSYDGNETAMFPIPEFGYNLDLGNGRAFAITVVGRGGMNSDYDNEMPLFSGGSGITPGIDLAQLYISPTFAMKVNQNHSVGVTLNAIYQRFKAQGMDFFANFSNDPSSVTSGEYDSSTGFSVGLGWTGKLSPTLTAGATYTSKASMSKFSKYAGFFPDEGAFDIPASLGLGIANKMSPDVTLAFDVTKIFYSDNKTTGNPFANFFGCPALTGGTNIDPACMGGANGPGFGWQDMVVYKVGLSWKAANDLVMRVGFNHGDNPIPSSETVFNILAPGVVEDHITLGATKTLANGGELTFMYMHAYENEVKGSVPGAFGGGNADIRMAQDAIGVAYGWDM